MIDLILSAALNAPASNIVAVVGVDFLGCRLCEREPAGDTCKRRPASKGREKYQFNSSSGEQLALIIFRYRPATGPTWTIQG